MRSRSYFTTDHPTWFFLAVANCKQEDNPSCFVAEDGSTSGYCQGPLLAEVAYNFTNGEDPTSKHFSYDEAGLRELYIAFFVFQTMLCL